ncbi:PREDICTED: LOW QUALITY PROTEIN: probable palmitoyltransferase ZDHHC19 [Dipodomys ordii]|uniref:Palmitoyltransferase n=1 Tax=Dipodomys ordii TaxID=10020 RepID=A0A1S3FDT0_DIPOR|nr:PREDICTED: LOW QUALITY PROTEIN: probable palmitoyltransferase ZDHHC19 [Dipodomys ordii]
MPFVKEGMPLVKEPQPPALGPLSWFLPSLFAAFNVVLLVIFSGLFFAFPCRWLAQKGEWAFPTVTGLLFILTFFSLISLNFSDPGILHQGSMEQSPMMVHVVWVNHRAFRLQWCPRCGFHRPPRTYHCPWCNICVEDFDHHCKWVNNCIGHRNFRFFMLLVLSLCLYSGALLVTCLIFLVRTSHLPLSIDKVMAILVAIPAAGFLMPLFLLLLIQALSVSAAERSYEGKCRYLQGYNPFDQGCASNWYLTICAPLGPKYMSEAVWLQRVVAPEWMPVSTLCPCALSPSSVWTPASASGSLCTRQGSPREWRGCSSPGGPEYDLLESLRRGHDRSTGNHFLSGIKTVVLQNLPLILRHTPPSPWPTDKNQGMTPTHTQILQGCKVPGASYLLELNLSPPANL